MSRLLLGIMKNTSIFRKALTAFAVLSSALNMSAQKSYIFLAPGVEEVEGSIRKLMTETDYKLSI